MIRLLSLFSGIGAFEQALDRIRKLTPRECFRLMGFTDAEFDCIKGVSNTQLYKQAGNSIVVNVLEAIFNRLLTEEEKHDMERQRKAYNVY